MRIRALLAIFSAVTLLLLSCGKEHTGTGTRDSVPPAAITDLAAALPTDSSLTLTWTAPGDDDTTGTAGRYDIRQAFISIDDSCWDSSATVGDVPVPQSAGTAETLMVKVLDADTLYYFAIKTSDSDSNWSALSNVASGQTMPTPDTIAPAAITALRVIDSAYSALTIAWTAPGDDGDSGIAAAYDIRYSTQEIDVENFDDADTVTGEPNPSTAGSDETFTITELEAVTIYYFAIKSVDEAGNWSGISNVPTGVSLAAPDTIPPASITDLHVTDEQKTKIRVSWTAPGDDGFTGTAASYNLRYSTSLLTEENFYQGVYVPDVPAPSPARTEESFTITGLNSYTGYYVAIKTADEVPNWSPISNVVVGVTRGDIDTIPPGAVTSLRPTTMKSKSIILVWYAPGDDGEAGLANQYDVRYSLTPIDDESWGTAIQVNAEPTPQLPGFEETMTIEEFEPSTFYYFAMKTQDTSGNWSPLSNVAEAMTSSSPQTWHTCFGWRSHVRSIDRTTGDRFVITGEMGGGIFAAQLDDAGNLNWVEKYAKSSYRMYPGAVAATHDGGCIVLGSQYQQWGDMMFHYKQDLILWRFDNEGETVWRTIYSALIDNLYAGNSIEVISDGGFIVGAGWSCCDLFSVSLLIKINFFGGCEWSGSVGDGEPKSVIELSNAGYALTGSIRPRLANNRDLTAVTLDEDMQLVWYKEFGGTEDDAGESILELGDGSLFIVGQTQSGGNGGVDIWLLKIDSLGNKVGENFIGGPGDDSAYGIIRTADGNYLVVGSTTSFGMGGSDIYLVKIDSRCEVLWEKTLGGPLNDGAYSVVLAPDAGFVVGGWTASYGPQPSPWFPPSYCYVLKTNANGEL